MAEMKYDSAGNRCDAIFKLPVNEDGTRMTSQEVQKWVRKNVKRAFSYYIYAPEKNEVSVTYQTQR